MSKEDQIIIALDTSKLIGAKELIKELWPRVKFFKIGLEMINTGQAPELVKFINKLGGKVFYDAKLNDIPSTVGRTVNVISKFGIWGFTVHASAGREAIRMAVKNKGRSGVVGVTVLTSIDDEESKSIFGDSAEKKVIQFADILLHEKCYGIVCSPREIKLIRKFKKFDNLIIITPGVRPVWAKNNEQKRTATPTEAIEAGADYLIIGRPITEPPNGVTSREAIDRVIQEIK